MIRTLSNTSMNTSSSSSEHTGPPPSVPRTRRFSLHSLATRLTDSKKNLLEHIPQRQQQITNFRKRAKSFLASSLIEHLSDFRFSPTTDRRNSTAGIISVDEIYRRINSTHADGTSSYEDNFPPPTFLQPSLLINEDQAKQILLELPIRLHGLNWYLTFSTETNGFSLNQLYRRSFELDRDLASLIIIKDIDQNIFGAFVSHQLTISESFYGNGESFLFTYFPHFRVFSWSGVNDFFVKGDVNGLGFGIGEGTYGLWIDGDLYHGRTSPSKTFNNDPLTANEDFLIASIEVWTFVD